MPRLTAFTTRWFDLMDAVGAQGQVVRIHLTTAAKARTLRAKWYGFKSALRKEGQDDDLRLADNVVCQIDQNDPRVVEFRSREAMWDAKAIASAIQQAKQKGGD